jgi:hypothetical protein
MRSSHAVEGSLSARQPLILRKRTEKIALTAPHQLVPQCFTRSSDNISAFDARFCARCTSPASSAALACSMYLRIWLMLSCWAVLSWREASCLRFVSVVASNWVVLWRCREACSLLTPGASWPAGSAVPPFLTTFFSGAESVFAATCFRRRRFLVAALVVDGGFFAEAAGGAFEGSCAGAGAGATRAG